VQQALLNFIFGKSYLNSGPIPVLDIGNRKMFGTCVHLFDIGLNPASWSYIIKSSSGHSFVTFFTKTQDVQLCFIILRR
jgi:hypothetical protein